MNLEKGKPLAFSGKFKKPIDFFGLLFETTPQQLRQHEKYSMIDQAFKGQKNLIPMINEPNNEALIMGIQHAGVRIGRRGWEKDKTEEKKQENEESLLEHRTDGTDAFDTLIIGMLLYPFKKIASAVGGSSFR